MAALGEPYVSLAELKSYIKVTKEGAGDDTELEDALESVSREVERHTQRQFNTDNAATVRRFVPDFPTWTYVHDFHSTDGLIVEVDTSGDGTWTVWDPADYQLEPLDGIVDGQDGWPFYKIRALTACFPMSRGGRATLRVTAQWGWSEVPEPVKQATKILAAETYTLRTAPLGVAGVDDYGIVRVRDSRMASSKLAKYMKHRVLVA